MKIIKSIKEKIGFYILRRNLKNINRERAVSNFDTAKTFGIVFDATVQKNYEKVRELLAFVSEKKIRVVAIGYIDNKNVLNVYSYQTGINFFSNKDLNWFRQPKCESVNNFINIKFDILVDLTLYSWFPIQYIIGNSKAKFKVGRLIEDDSFYDMMIDVSKNESIEYFIKQVKHYLSVINK